MAVRSTYIAGDDAAVLSMTTHNDRVLRCAIHVRKQLLDNTSTSDLQYNRVKEGVMDEQSGESKKEKEVMCELIGESETGADPKGVARGRMEAPRAEAPWAPKSSAESASQVERRRREDRGAKGV